MNTVNLIGRLTKDPELKNVTTENIPVCSFTLAVNRNNGKDEADFINCVAWRETATNLCKFMKKGYQIAIEGELTSRNYTDNSGAKHYNLDVYANRIQFLESKKADSTGK